MRPYEVMLILDSAVEDTTIDNVVSRITDIVTAKGGTVGQVAKWGRRRFAYEMNHRLEGYYALVDVTSAADGVADLDRALTLSDDVVRHKIVRLPDSIAGREKPAPNQDASEEVSASTGAES